MNLLLSHTSGLWGRTTMNITPSISYSTFQWTLTASAGWKGSKHASRLSGLLLFIYKKVKLEILFSQAADYVNICYKEQVNAWIYRYVFFQYLCRLWRWFRLRRLRDITLWETTVLHSYDTQHCSCIVCFIRLTIFGVGDMCSVFVSDVNVLTGCAFFLTSGFTIHASILTGRKEGEKKHFRSVNSRNTKKTKFH